MKIVLIYTIFLISSASIANSKSGWIDVNIGVAPEDPYSQGAKLVFDNNGRMYTSAAHSQNVPGLVIRSSDGGLTWQTLDSWLDGDISRILISKDRSIYAIGDIKNSWVVKKSSDDGKTWSIVDQVVKGSAVTLIETSNGALFVGGSKEVDRETTPGFSVNHGLIRRSRDGGLTWRDALILKSVSDFDCDIGALASDSKGDVFSGGTCLEISSGGISQTNILEMSSDGGWVWKVKDKYGTKAYDHNSIRSIATANDGRVAYTGAVSLPPYGDNSNVAWFTRLSSDGGETWVLSDLQKSQIDGPNNGDNAYEGRDLIFDRSGNLIATGNAFDSKYYYGRWMVRALPFGSSTWSTVDIISNTPFTQACSITESPNGDFWSSGRLNNDLNKPFEKAIRHCSDQCLIPIR